MNVSSSSPKQYYGSGGDVGHVGDDCDDDYDDEFVLMKQHHQHGEGKGDETATIASMSSSSKQNSKPSTSLQLAAVAAYIGSDTILRFCYRDVIAGTTRESGDDDGGGGGDDAAVLAYDKPMFLSYCAYVCFAFWGFLVVPYVWWIRRITLSDHIREWCGHMSLYKALQWCMVVVLLMNYQNYFYLSGLRYVRVAVSTAVGQSEAPFTVLFSVWALARRFSRQELKGVILCLLGIAWIVLPPALRNSKNNQNQYDNDDEQQQQQQAVSSSNAWDMFLGVLFTILGALFFALYQVFWQKFDQERFPSSAASNDNNNNNNKALALLEQHQQDAEENQVQQQQHNNNNMITKQSGLLASVMDSMTTIAISGMCNLVGGLVLLLLMHVTGAERIEMPPRQLWGEIIPTCFLSAFVDAINGIACVVATAVIVAMCYPLTIPLSVILEVFWGGIPLSAFGYAGWIGTIMVVAGIFFMETEEDEYSCQGGGGCSDGLEIFDREREDSSMAESSS